MANLKDMVNTTGQMNHFSKVSLRMDFVMAKEFGKKVLEITILMRGSISVIKNVEMEFSHGRQVMSIKVAISMI